MPQVFINVDPDNSHENLLIDLPGAGETVFHDMPARREALIQGAGRFLFAEYEGRLVGGIWQHPRLDNGEPCGGCVYFRGYGNKPNPPQWDLLCENPLTLSPSLQCNVCGRHVFVRDGREV